MPARIVAVSSLLLDVLDDLSRKSDLDFGSSEGAFFTLLAPAKAELQAIHRAAVKEMQDLAPRFLDSEAIRAAEG